MPGEMKTKGPASYFPSIEKTYGKPITHWMRVLRKAGPLKHMELVSVLKAQDKLGHVVEVGRQSVAGGGKQVSLQVAPVCAKIPAG